MKKQYVQKTSRNAYVIELTIDNTAKDLEPVRYNRVLCFCGGGPKIDGVNAWIVRLTLNEDTWPDFISWLNNNNSKEPFVEWVP